MKPEVLSQEVQEILVKTFEANRGNIRSIEMGENYLILIDGKKISDNNDDRYLKALTEDGHKLAEEIQ